MKLKYILPIIAPVILTACEEAIDPGHRFTPASTPEIRRSVLVEEYTDAECINSPRGHALLDALGGYYNTEANLEQGNELIVVGIYVPGRGDAAGQGGLITPEAANFLPEGVVPPQARVNRISGVLDLAEWSKVIAEQISREPGVSFPDRMTATTDGSTVSVEGAVLSGNNIVDARLHVWLVEDGITYSQAMPDGTADSRYVHRNVYRAHMTESCSGTAFALTRNVARRFTFTLPVSEKWNMANMRVVMFVETPTGGVLNADQKRVIQL